MTPDKLDLIAGWVSLVLTLMVFSYLLGDNVLYRLAIHVLVGVAAGALGPGQPARRAIIHQNA